MVWVATPSASITFPPMPGIRIFSPLRSSTLFTSGTNQPPICTPVFPPGKLITPKSASSSQISASPPPSRSQALCWRDVSPKGTQVSKARAGFLPM